MIAAHCVEYDFTRQQGAILRLVSHRRVTVWLGLFDLNYFAVFVVATLRTDAVLQTRFLTIRTEGGLRREQRIVRAAFSAASLGMSSFWIWHNYSVRKS
jgi:hypothetical protein